MRKNIRIRKKYLKKIYKEGLLKGNVYMKSRYFFDYGAKTSLIKYKEGSKVSLEISRLSYDAYQNDWDSWDYTTTLIKLNRKSKYLSERYIESVFVGGEFVRVKRLIKIPSQQLKFYTMHL